MSHSVFWIGTFLLCLEIILFIFVVGCMYSHKIIGLRNTLHFTQKRASQFLGWVPTDEKNNLADDSCDALVQDLWHDKVEQALLLLPKYLRVVRMARQVGQRVGRAPQHVQAGAHALGVVAQRVDPVLLRHHHRIVLNLQIIFWLESGI